MSKIESTGKIRASSPVKAVIKDFLGELPLVPELYWQLRMQGKPLNKSFSLRLTEDHLPEWLTQLQRAQLQLAQLQRAGLSKGGDNGAKPARKIFIFTTLRYWIEHGTLLSLALAGLGHEVTFAYLPVNNFQKPIKPFDIRQQSAYAARVLKPARGFITPLNLLDVRPEKNNLPENLENAIREVSLRDAQYTLQIEKVDLNSELYQLRLERNLKATRAALAWLSEHRPDVVLTPNGSIIARGAVYQVAKYLAVPVVTYEFGEQRGRIWLATDDEVMLQNTNEMWAALSHSPLDDNQRARIEALYASRRGASLWENFSRRWQGIPSQGSGPVRSLLGLDERPVVLLAANVIGDSLTLGRQVFSRDMTEWLQETIRSFAARTDVQLVVRIHPGERYTKGPSVADIIKDCMPDLPDYIHLVAAGDPVNTYDLVEIADLGLVYTTTVGMEMAMSGVPVIVAGQTHYRGKGFTIDPISWEDYHKRLDQLLGALGGQTGSHPERSQVELAWQYAYQFFFEYPLSFPWHMLYFWEELEDWPLEKALSPEGQSKFYGAFQILTGEPRHWVPIHSAGADLDESTGGLLGMEAETALLQYQGMTEP